MRLLEVSHPGMQVRQRGGPGRGQALPEEVGLPAVRGHLLDQVQRAGRPQGGGPAGRLCRPTAHKGALTSLTEFLFSCAGRGNR